MASDIVCVNFGADQIVVGRGSNANVGELVRNSTGGLTVKTKITFQGDKRIVGEGEAYRKNCSVDILRHLGQTETISVAIDGVEKKFKVEQLIAILFQKIREVINDEGIKAISICVQPSWSAKEIQSIIDGAKIANYEIEHIIANPMAISQAYAVKHSMKTKEPRKVLFVDMGADHFSAFVSKFELVKKEFVEEYEIRVEKKIDDSSVEAKTETKSEETNKSDGDEEKNETTDNKEEEDKKATTTTTTKPPMKKKEFVTEKRTRTKVDEKFIIKIMSCINGKTLCGNALDKQMFGILANQAADKYKVNVDMNTRVGLRLLKESEKTKTILSGLNDTRVHFEQLTEDMDADFMVSRALFEDKCKEFSQAFKQAMVTSVNEAGLEVKDIHSVEFVGGATRVPLFGQIIQDLFNKEHRVTLDTTACVVCGSTCCVDYLRRNSPSEPEAKKMKLSYTQQVIPVVDKIEIDYENVEMTEGCGVLSAEELEDCIKQEQEMLEKEAKLIETENARNKLEARIFEVRNAVGQSDLLNGDDMMPLLSTAEDWIWSDEGFNGDAELFNQKIIELEEQLKPFMEAYEQHKKEAKEKLEAELAKDSAKAAAEKVDEDHDTRKLKKADRMRLVMRNKDEGNELFKGTNYKHAAVRYNKALNHCVKFIDLSPQDQSQVDALKVSLYTNLAMCFWKIENPIKCLNNCNFALEIDSKNKKALFRRASCLEKKKDYKNAMKDITLALEENPEDKALLKLKERVEKAIRRKKAQDKARAKKMFKK
eukprot:TRINITY_DN2310_c0_g1_i1.p1 TRINITY_DN2310_c0_g1~~TRINITY_DN2310_c0_g1_i1.p1  ORF type:complete len:767 (+),score=282.14 TRINITY_DN2310_c0_g1_i1:48-2348(+)